MNKMKIRKGDEVVVISGKSKGKKGVVKKVFPKISSILMEGVNVYKKAVRPSQNNNENYVVSERALLVSKVKLLKKGSEEKIKTKKSLKK